MVASSSLLHDCQITEAYIDTQETEAATPYLEPSGAYSSLQPKPDDYEELGLLTERNLVDFARQIAAGMVSCLLNLMIYNSLYIDAAIYTYYYMYIIYTYVDRLFMVEEWTGLEASVYVFTVHVRVHILSLMALWQYWQLY